MLTLYYKDSLRIKRNENGISGSYVRYINNTQASYPCDDKILFITTYGNIMECINNHCELEVEKISELYEARIGIIRAKGYSLMESLENLNTKLSRNKNIVNDIHVKILRRFNHG